MRLRFPLFAKILLWFFLNLALLGGLFYGFVRVQYRLGLDSLLLRQAEERIQAVSELIAAELRQSLENRDEILERFSAAYKMQFLLLREDGLALSGPALPIPGELIRRLRERSGPGGRRPMGPGPGEQRPPPGQFEDRPGPRRGPPLRQPGGDLGGEFLGREPMQEGPFPKFMVRTQNPTRYWIVVRIPPQDGPGPGRRPLVLVAVSESLGGWFFDPAPWAMLAGAAVALSILFWLPLLHGMGRSISQMTRATEQIADGRFDVQVDAARRDELGRLGAAINRMTARLGGFVGGQKRFLGDTAHELCSPLARMQMVLGLLERRAGDEQKDYIEDLREEVQEMSSLVNELLSFSKASLRPEEVRLGPVDVRRVVDEAVRRESGERTEIRIDIPEGLHARGARELLQRAVTNLIRNALRYAGHAGPVTISAARQGPNVLLTVADCGPGVPEEHVAKLFDPFYRVEASRDRQSGGAGLGLTIVKTCVEACGGEVSCGNRRPTGFEVTLLLKAWEG